MIIKVPIYVEFESKLPEGDLHEMMEKLNKLFTRSLRREKFEKDVVEKLFLKNIEKHIQGELHLLTREQALEKLRTSN